MAQTVELSVGALQAPATKSAQGGTGSPPLDLTDHVLMVPPTKGKGVPFVGRIHIRVPTGQSELAAQEAGEWALRSWDAVYDSLTAREAFDCRPEKFGDECKRFVVEVSEIYLRVPKGPLQAVAYLKEQLSYVMAAQAESELPSLGADALKHPGILSGGWVRKRLRRLMRIHSKKNLVRAYDVLNAKIGCPRVPDEFIQAALDSHRVQLSTDHTDLLYAPFKVSGMGHETSIRPDAVEIELIQDRIKQRIHDLTIRLFGGRVLPLRTCIPSFNACFSSSDETGELKDGSRASGGGAGSLFRKFRDGREAVEDDKVELLFQDSLTGLERTHHVRLHGNSLVDEFQDFVDAECLETIRRGYISARPAAIPEPLKVRIITAGEPAAYYRLLEIQKWIHGIMKGCPAMQHIGGPITADSWAKAFPPVFVSELLSEGRQFVSGDYKASTDYIMSTFSEFAWDEIVSCTFAETAVGEKQPLCETVWAPLGRLALTGHKLHYSIPGAGGSKPSMVSVDQQWGQLMGSPVSFPILSIINLAATSVALGLSVDDICSEHCQVLVNGDDVAFLADHDQYVTWNKCVRSVGLIPSLGKNYTSSRFMIMNSELRYFDPKAKDWSLLGFVNLSLLWGHERKGPEGGDDMRGQWTWMDLGPRGRDLLRGIEDPNERAALLERFEFEHRDILQNCPPGLSFRASEQLGGAGLPDGEIPEGNLLNHAWLCTMTPAERRKTLNAPSFRRRTWVETMIAECEDHYSRYGTFDNFRQEDNRVDDHYELNFVFKPSQWSVERPGLGNKIVLGYLLKSFLQLDRIDLSSGKAFRDQWLHPFLSDIMGHPVGSLRATQPAIRGVKGRTYHILPFTDRNIGLDDIDRAYMISQLGGDFRTLLKSDLRKMSKVARVEFSKVSVPNRDDFRQATFKHDLAVYSNGLRRLLGSPSTMARKQKLSPMTDSKCRLFQEPTITELAIYGCSVSSAPRFQHAHHMEPHDLASGLKSGPLDLLGLSESVLSLSHDREIIHDFERELLSSLPPLPCLPVSSSEVLPRDDLHVYYLCTFSSHLPNVGPALFDDVDLRARTVSGRPVLLIKPLRTAHYCPDGSLLTGIVCHQTSGEDPGQRL